MRNTIVCAIGVSIGAWLTVSPDRAIERTIGALLVPGCVWLCNWASRIRITVDVKGGAR